MHQCFRSTYVCEAAFYFINVIKTKQRAVLTDYHLGNCLKVVFDEIHE